MEAVTTCYFPTQGNYGIFWRVAFYVSVLIGFIPAWSYDGEDEKIFRFVGPVDSIFVALPVVIIHAVLLLVTHQKIRDLDTEIVWAALVLCAFAVFPTISYRNFALRAGYRRRLMVVVWCVANNVAIFFSAIRLYIGPLATYVGPYDQIESAIRHLGEAMQMDSSELDFFAFSLPALIIAPSVAFALTFVAVGAQYQGRLVDEIEDAVLKRRIRSCQPFGFICAVIMIIWVEIGLRNAPPCQSGPKTVSQWGFVVALACNFVSPFFFP